MGGVEASQRPAAAPEDLSLERRMLEEYGSDEEIYDVAAELQNLDAMMNDLETTSSPAPNPKHASATTAKREVQKKKKKKQKIQQLESLYS